MEKFLADESVDFRLITYLRDNGYEIKAIMEINPGISDEEVLSMSNDMGVVLITEDKDFGELTYRLRKKNQGVILIRMDGLTIEKKVLKIQQILQNYLPELKGKFTVATIDKVRIKQI
jgi:predicted nuclease of predicted toxin-antitoxin system